MNKEEIKDYYFSNYLKNYLKEHTPIFKPELDSIENFNKWKTNIIAKVKELMGVPLENNTFEINAKVLSEEETDIYTAKTYIYRASEFHNNTATIALPKKRDKNPLRAFIVLTGHHPHPGTTALLGIEPYKKNRDIALKLLKEGYAVIIPSIITQGEKLEPDINRYRNKLNKFTKKYFNINLIRSCQKQFFELIVTGQTLMGIRMLEILNSLKILKKFPEIDSENLGCMGLSLGGVLTVYFSLICEKIKTVIAAGCFTTYKKHLIESNTCLCICIPGIYKYVDFPYLAACLAPRKLYIQNGDSDYFIPFSGALEGKPVVEKAYSLFKKNDNLKFDFFKGGHDLKFAPIKSWLNL